jgi:hypothetical protein
MKFSKKGETQKKKSHYKEKRKKFFVKKTKKFIFKKQESIIFENSANEKNFLFFIFVFVK